MELNERCLLTFSLLKGQVGAFGTDSEFVLSG